MCCHVQTKQLVAALPSMFFSLDFLLLGSTVQSFHELFDISQEYNYANSGASGFGWQQ